MEGSMIKIGSLFSGIGGFELGLERAIPGAKTIWQVEQNAFCQKVLAKHWPDAKIYNDVRNITKDNVEPIDILCGGFPCQDISLAGKGAGLHGKKSGLWWEMLRVISELSAGPKKPIVVLENVAAILFRGGCEVVGSLAEIGYCTEWTVISARDQGAPHLRKRWFAVAYPDSIRNNNKAFFMHEKRIAQKGKKQNGILSDDKNIQTNARRSISSDSSIARSKIEISTSTSRQKRNTKKSIDSHHRSSRRTGKSYWSSSPSICGVDDGIPYRVDRLRALGNAIVPQCSEWVGHQIVKSGLLEELS
jgi:DNA (cytosine-5)-methyltransferase 1